MNALLAIGYWLLALPQFAAVSASRQRRSKAPTSQQPEASNQWRLLTWLVVVVLVGSASAQEVHIPIHDGWQFQQVGKEQWYPAEVPGVVHTDLLRNGLIPDPYIGSNVDSVQWIENEDWIYKRTIFATDTLLKHGHLDLVFKGLDTFAEVYLNDSLLGKADNMFRSWEWPVKELLRKGKNELKVIFRSPIKEGAKLRDAYGIQLPHDNDPSGVSPYMRKAAYQFGWDFCPRLVTSGIWQGVELRGWSKMRISSVSIVPYPANKHGNTPTVHVDPSYVVSTGSKAHIKIFLDDSLVDQHIRDPKFHDRYEIDPAGALIDIARLNRWNPRGYGQQAMHKLRIECWVKGDLLSVWEDAIGFATTRLDPHLDAEGAPFTFLINERRVFAKGANLVPPSMFPNGGDDKPWIDLVKQMQESSMNMVRVWSGGIYPPEAFFDACDTAGIMVWQDLMFANLRPGSNEYRKTAYSEVYEFAERICHHPSIVLFCGDNELDVAWKNWGWQERYGLHGRDSVGVWKHQLEFVADNTGALSPALHVPYTPTSPLSNWGNAEGLKSGDLHYWGVWHGDSTFASFKNNVGRFVSEYGFQSYPDSALLAKYIDPKELFLGSPALKRLQRSYKTDQPIWDAIHRELGVEPKTLGEFIEASQEVQAKAYRMAAEAHIAAQPHCMGTLLWQLNDCWPGPSWSIIDFDGRPKPAYDAIKEVYSRP